MTTKPKKLAKVQSTKPAPVTTIVQSKATDSVAREVAEIVARYEALRDSDGLYLADGSEDVVALFSLAVEEAIELEDLRKSAAAATMVSKRAQTSKLTEARLNALVRVLGGDRLSDPEVVLRNGRTEGAAWAWAIETLTHLLAEPVAKRDGVASGLAWLTLARIAPDEAMTVYANGTQQATGGLAAVCANTALAYVLERSEFELVPHIAVQLELATADQALDDLTRAECAETLGRIYLGSTQPEQALVWAVMAVQIYRKLSRQSKLVEALAMLSECYLRCKQPDDALSVATERVTIAHELLRSDPTDEFAQVRAADADQALQYVHSLRKPRRAKA